jgi:hypothetical protein
MDPDKKLEQCLNTIIQGKTSQDFVFLERKDGHLCISFEEVEDILKNIPGEYRHIYDKKYNLSKRDLQKIKEWYDSQFWLGYFANGVYNILTFIPKTLGLTKPDYVFNDLIIAIDQGNAEDVKEILYNYPEFANQCINYEDDTCTSWPVSLAVANGNAKIAKEIEKSVIVNYDETEIKKNIFINKLTDARKNKICHDPETTISMEEYKKLEEDEIFILPGDVQHHCYDIEELKYMRASTKNAKTNIKLTSGQVKYVNEVLNRVGK